MSYAHLKFKLKAGVSTIMRLGRGGSIGHSAGRRLGKPDEKAGTSTSRGCESVIRVPLFGARWGLLQAGTNLAGTGCPEERQAASWCGGGWRAQYPLTSCGDGTRYYSGRSGGVRACRCSLRRGVAIISGANGGKERERGGCGLGVERAVNLAPDRPQTVARRAAREGTPLAALAERSKSF